MRSSSWSHTSPPTDARDRRRRRDRRAERELLRCPSAAPRAPRRRAGSFATLALSAGDSPARARVHVRPLEAPHRRVEDVERRLLLVAQRRADGVARRGVPAQVGRDERREVRPIEERARAPPRSAPSGRRARRRRTAAAAAAGSRRLRDGEGDVEVGFAGRAAGGLDGRGRRRRRAGRGGCRPRRGPARGRCRGGSCGTRRELRPSGRPAECH